MAHKLSYSLTKSLLVKWVADYRATGWEWNYARKILSQRLIKLGIPSKITNTMWRSFNFWLYGAEYNTLGRLDFESQYLFIDLYLETYVKGLTNKEPSILIFGLTTQKTKRFNQLTRATSSVVQPTNSVASESIRFRKGLRYAPKALDIDLENIKSLSSNYTLVINSLNDSRKKPLSMKFRQQYLNYILSTYCYLR